jgi:predicted aldo/keto reductase-like oxidoreductase
MDRILDIQLKKLRTYHIDYYLIHSLEAGLWKKMQGLGVLEFLDSAKASGKIRNAGFSFHGDLRTFKEIIDSYDWTFCQIQYNFLDETSQAGTEGLRYAASKRLAVMVMEPLRGGMLASKVPKAVEKIYAGPGMKRSPAEWALRWVWNHPEVTIVLSGMNNEAHIDENIRACETALPGSMTPGELETMDKVAAAYKRLMKVGCTGCAYCIPCPSGVNIPACFSHYNDYYMGAGRMMSRGLYGFRLMGGLSPPSDASLCTGCGRCVKACPQKIDIPGELGKVKRKMGGLTTKAMIPLIRMMFSGKVEE